MTNHNHKPVLLTKIVQYKFHVDTSHCCNLTIALADLILEYEDQLCHDIYLYLFNLSGYVYTYSLINKYKG